MIYILLITSCLATACVSGTHKFLSRTPSGLENDKSIVLDSHVHINFNNLDSPFVEPKDKHKTFLLSPAYMCGDYRDYQGPNCGIEFNNDVADVVSENPNFLIGICGINFQDKEAHNVLKKCLMRPEMIGAKLRWYGEGKDGELRITNPDIYSNVVNAISANVKNLKVIVIHTASQSYKLLFDELRDELGNEVEQRATIVRDVAEIDTIVEIVTAFPQTQFILAHSLGSPELTHELAKRVSKKQLQNLWIDTSGSIVSDVKYFKAFVNSWRRFGIDHVLFGSDSKIGSANLPELLKNFETLGELTGEEQDKIFRKNGERLLKKIQEEVKSESN